MIDFGDDKALNFIVSSFKTVIKIYVDISCSDRRYEVRVTILKMFISKYVLKDAPADNLR